MATAPALSLKIVRNPDNPLYWKQLVSDVSRYEKWFNTESDLSIWRQGFGDDNFSLYVAIDVDKDKAVGCASGVNHYADGKPLVTMIGMVFVHPDYRGHGLALVLSNKVMSSDVGLPNKGLYGVQSMTHKYEKTFGFGLRAPETLKDIEIDLSKIRLPAENPKAPGITVKSPSKSDWPSIFAYDHKFLSGGNRDKYLQLQCSQPRSVFKIGINESGEVVGFCLIRTQTLIHAAYVAPFYAESPEIAAGLFVTTAREALNRFSDGLNHVRVGGYPETTQVLALLKAYVQEESDIDIGKIYNSQFTQNILNVPKDKVYSVTETDVTFV